VHDDRVCDGLGGDFSPRRALRLRGAVRGGRTPPDVRWVVLHMIEETARHAGHLDIARELIDGQTGLGPR
jgi:hypothetical protein